MIERMTIADPTTAKRLANERQRHIVLALVEREYSQHSLAIALGMSLNLLHYHLAKLVDAGLVVVTRSQARRGRPVLLYRASAREFFVPAMFAPMMPNFALLKELGSALETSRAGTCLGILYRYELGPRMNLIRDPSASAPAAELWHRLRLGEADAKALIEELQSLFARYAERARPTGRAFLALGALAPIPD